MNERATNKLTVSDFALLHRVKQTVLLTVLLVLAPAWIGWALQIALPVKTAAQAGMSWIIFLVVMLIQLALLFLLPAKLTNEIAAVLSTLRGFTQDVAHELSTPVGLLDFRLQIIERAQEANQIPNAEFEILKQALERMKTLVEDFRLLAKSERPVNPGGLAFVKVDNVVRSVCEQVAPLLLEKKVTIDMTDLGSVSIIGERERLERALLNLLINAISHVKENGEIKISMTGSSRFFDLKVKDNGEGISAELLPHIFERFRRSAESVDGEPVARGSGLGLAIVKAIVESHGGSVGVKSTPGNGAEFTLHWPKNPMGGRFTRQILSGSQSDD